MGLSDYLKSLDKYEDRGQVDPPVETCLPTLVLHPQEKFVQVMLYSVVWRWWWFNC